MEGELPEQGFRLYSTSVAAAAQTSAGTTPANATLTPITDPNEMLLVDSINVVGTALTAENFISLRIVLRTPTGDAVPLALGIADSRDYRGPAAAGQGLSVSFHGRLTVPFGWRIGATYEKSAAVEGATIRTTVCGKIVLIGSVPILGAPQTA